MPVATWNMCKPVMVKKVAPNKGVGNLPSEVVNVATQWAGKLNGRRPSLIKWFHSMRCRTTKAAPKTIVARIHLRAAALSPRLDADTPKTIVRLDESKQKVMTDEKMILGRNGKGVGQTFDARRKL